MALKVRTNMHKLTYKMSWEPGKCSIMWRDVCSFAEVGQ